MKTLAALALIGGLGMAPALAAGPNPEGSWQSSNGEARVNVTLCGDGTQLCAQLISVSGEARTEGNLELLNAYVVNEARPVTETTWKGTVHFDGDSAMGSIELVSDSTMTVSGCKLICKTFEFNRI
jgi:hypothetical protein